MFGLMRFRSTPAAGDEERRRWRLHYCGTCKTIGRRYGQRSRLLLNHDTVFLGELLTSLASQDTERWAPAYHSRNCFHLPSAGETPDVLRYSAAATVLLSEYKVDDHRADSGRARWTWVRRLLSRSFGKARDDLKSFGFPVRECDAILGRQTALEQLSIDLDAVAGPTAEATRLVFHHGARIAGLAGESLGEIGYRFGYLTYLLDAWKDFHQDARTGAFNALRANGLERAWAARTLREQAGELQAALAEAGAPVDLQMRFRSAIEHELGGQLRVVHSCGVRARQTLRGRWRDAKTRARELRTPAWAFAAVLAMAFLFPVHARSARTHSECLSLGLNAMAVGSLLAAVHVGDAHRGCFGKLWDSCCSGWLGGCDDCCCDSVCDSCSCCECGSCCDCGDCCGSCDCDC